MTMIKEKFKKDYSDYKALTNFNVLLNQRRFFFLAQPPLLLLWLLLPRQQHWARLSRPRTHC